MVDDNPEGGKWTYDDENRKNIPKIKYHQRSLTPRESHMLKMHICI